MSSNDRSHFLILGCGYTGKAVARLLSNGGAEVSCSNRQPGSLPGVHCFALEASDAASVRALPRQVSEGVRVLYSIPGAEPGNDLMEAIRSCKPERMVYLSTTGVYGEAERVDELTVPSGADKRAGQRLRTERMLEEGPWPTLVLRPAAIYGAERGVHIAVRDGNYARAAEWNRVVSRIHVRDLALQAKTALESDLTGQFPAADEVPCRSIEVAEFAAALLGRKLPVFEFSVKAKGRCVDGSAIRRALGLQLIYPTYREGVRDCLA